MSGVFGLREVRTEQLDLTWEESANYGYFGGGATPGSNYYCTIDRIDFSTETVSAPGNNLTQARSNLAAVSNSNYGYFGGGEAFPSAYSIIDRLDFSTETVEIRPSLLTAGRTRLSAVSSNNYGYFGGGATLPPLVTTIDRLDFSTETVTGPPIHGLNLSQARNYLSGVFNSDYGYFVGGGNPSTPTKFSTIDRLDFSNETISTPGSKLTKIKNSQATVSNYDYGYICGGSEENPSPPPTYRNSCTINRIDFSTDSVIEIASQLRTARSSSSASGNFNYGYLAGGSTTISSIDRLDFTTETVTTPAPRLTQGRNSFASVSGGSRINARKVRVGITTDNVPISSTYGYFGGGNVPPQVSTIDRLDFSNETVSAPGNNLTKAAFRLAAVSNSNYGYFGGDLGFDKVLDRIDFSNETVSAPGKTLPSFNFLLAAVSNSNYGYFGGGYAPFTLPRVRSNIDRLDFSTETSLALTQILTQARYGLAAVSNSNYGYFGGGFSFPPSFTPAIYHCTIDRLDFSNETVSNPPANLTQARRELAAVSNSNYGYFAGGFAPPTVNTIDRLDFSNETVSAPGNNLTQRRDRLATVSNSNYGYFGGGFSPPLVCTIDRLDFTTETVTAPAPTLTQARSSLAAVSN
jgi:hypothetical protein